MKVRATGSEHSADPVLDGGGCSQSAQYELGRRDVSLAHIARTQLELLEPVYLPLYSFFTKMENEKRNMNIHFPFSPKLD